MHQSLPAISFHIIALNSVIINFIKFHASNLMHIVSIRLRISINKVICGNAGIPLFVSQGLAGKSRRKNFFFSRSVQCVAAFASGLPPAFISAATMPRRKNQGEPASPGLTDVSLRGHFAPRSPRGRSNSPVSCMPLHRVRDKPRQLTVRIAIADLGTCHVRS